MTNEAAKELIVSRVFAATRELVFQAWSSAEHVKQWFCPETYSVPEAQIEFREGGAFNVCMQSAQGHRHWTRGRFTQIVANTRLVIDMQATDDQERALFRAYTIVTFSEQRGGSTLLEVRQTYTVFDQAALPMIAGAQPGWGQTLDRLEKEVTRIKQRAPANRSVSFGTFCIERTWPVSRSQVFKALSDPEAKSQWFGGGSTLLVREMDVRPGGHERVSGRWESGVVSTFDARYYDVIADERIVYSYEMYLDDRRISVSLATFELKSAGTGTRLVMTEQGAFLDGYDDAGSREAGSNFLLDAMGKWLGAQH
jgi:uncharacterized protein YndB with AHSA1/START domain